MMYFPVLLEKYHTLDMLLRDNNIYPSVLTVTLPHHITMSFIIVQMH